MKVFIQSELKKEAYGGIYYNEKASKEAWKITLEFLKKHGA